MAILSGVLIISCQSIDDTLEFYQRMLQFVIVKKREINGELQWVHLMHGETTLMLQRSEQLAREENQPFEQSLSLYFFINDIKELHHFLKVNYKDVSDITSTLYHMQEFHLSDPEGNVITLGMKEE